MMQKDIPSTKKFSLIELLQSFEKKEITQFYHFVTSAYFNKDKFVMKLLKALKKYVSNRQPFNETIQYKVYKEVFGTTNTNSLVLTKEQKKLLWIKMTLLNGLARRFLVIEALDKNPAYEVELLHQQLLKKKQYKSSERLIKKRQVQLENEAIKDDQYYEVAFHTEKSKMNMLYQTGKIVKEDNFLTLNYHLDMNYLIHKLKFSLTMHSIANANKQKSYDFDSIDAIINLLNTSLPIPNPLIKLYLTVIQLLRTYNEENYTTLLILLEEYSPYIPKNILIDFYAVACNFCMNEGKKGKLDSIKKLYDLYKIIDDKDLLLEKNHLQIVKLKNIVGVSCDMRDFEWATKIVHKYYIYAEKEVQKSVYHLNIGAIQFYQSNYKEAISHFIRVEKINLAYDIDCKIMLLKSYYQMDKQYDERTMQIFRSAERFIDANKELPYAPKKSYKNFIQILINLYRVRHKVGKQTKESLTNKLAKMPLLNNKKWLLEKISEL